jgi:hypothetical protein
MKPRAPARGHRVFLETAFDLDQPEHQLRVETRARRFVVHRAQEFETCFRLGMRFSSRRDISVSQSIASIES